MNIALDMLSLPVVKLFASCVLGWAGVCSLASSSRAADGDRPAATVAAVEPVAPVAPDRQEVIRYAAKSGDGTWQKATNRAPSLSSRELFICALAYAEADVNMDRLETLFRVAAEMQDRDKTSKGYGNFRWSRSNEKVMDFNAVEFCMQGGALLWLRHRERMSAEAKKCLREILDYAVEGCMRHKVRDTYTNIALMNAQNLILLGEAIEVSAAADEGYRRLNGVVKRTLESGISEYGSPTYYAVDLDCLLLIEAFCRREDGRRQARAMLELFWTEIALNWFEPSQRFGGAHSRDYDYVWGHGGVETHLWIAGWISGAPRGSIGAVLPALGRRPPPARLLEMSRNRFPRLVRQMWGERPDQSRVHFLMKDVCLGSAGANYWNMDVPLTVDLPGSNTFPRCYFIPDCRHDPYGKVKIQEGAGPHSKTLHLRPFWTAAQRTVDAVGIVLYRPEDMMKERNTLESHFVMPANVDSFWIGEKQAAMKSEEQASLPVEGGQTLVLRKGTAAVGVRILWARAVDGKPAPAALVSDGNAYGVVRLTVTHAAGKEQLPDVTGAGAVMWVRVGGGLAGDQAFHAWRNKFAGDSGNVEVAAGRLRASVAGADGAVRAEIGYPDGTAPAVDPPYGRTVLELDGEDIGRKLLESVSAKSEGTNTAKEQQAK